MLTVKHINIAGDEKLYEAFGVELRRGSDYTKTGGQGDPRATVDSVSVQIDEDNLTTTLFGGTVFVMNRHGSTISRYDLGASPIPLSADPATFGHPIVGGQPIGRAA